MFKEYFKGVALLGAVADERLVRIKNEKRLYSDVKKEKGINISNSYTPSKSKVDDKFKNERGGR